MNKKNILRIIGTLLLLIALLLIVSTYKELAITKSKTNLEPINIVYITDNNYATYTRTSIRSVIANKKKNTKIRIYVIGYRLSDSNIEKIQKEKRKNTDIELIKVPRLLLKKFSAGAKSNPYVTRADNAKLFLPSLLNRTDKVLYLDGDTIILKDLSDLYYTNLNDNYIGAVDDWQTSWPDVSGKRYFNNGVMLLNLQKIRKDNIEAKLINYKLHDKNNRFVTQDAYNAVMFGKILYLPLIYDTFAPEFDDKISLLSKIKTTLKEHYDPKIYPYKTAKEYQKDVTIIHYCGYGNQKPWYKIDFKRKSNNIWYKYAPFDFWIYCLKGNCRNP